MTKHFLSLCVAALCDVESGRARASLQFLAGKGLKAAVYAGEEESYKALCEDPDVELVYICTDWLHHVPVALYAMEQGKHVAIEVPSATTLKDCWDLVNTSERTRRHCMILENCCYDFFELTAELETTAREVGGHGGMDFIMDYRLIYCLNKGLPLDMDVYDLAEWCCVSELSRISLENGSAPVAVPDFTRGAWNKVNGFSYAFAQ